MQRNELKHFGFIAPIRKKGDYVFGISSLPISPINENGDWTPYLPEYEVQTTLNGEDTTGCTVWGTENGIEVLYKFLKSQERNFSERFIYILANIHPPGADPFMVGETIRKNGLVDQNVLPMTSTFEEFVQPNPLPEDIIQRGKLFTDLFDFKHEYLFTEQTPKEYKRSWLKQAIKCSPIGVSLCAWFQDENGLYYRPEGMPDTHWCLLVKMEKDYDLIFDSYDHSLKKIRKDMDYGTAIRYYLKEKVPYHKLSLWERIINFFKKLYGIQ